MKYVHMQVAIKLRLWQSNLRKNMCSRKLLRLFAEGNAQFERFAMNTEEFTSLAVSAVLRRMGCAARPAIEDAMVTALETKFAFPDLQASGLKRGIRAVEPESTYSGRSMLA